MSSGDNVPVQEIVIVRRGHGNHEEGHHGGMWKIAFADFMTAMMAFFLVMWLLSASDEKKLDQLTTYFNPIKLPDTQKSEKVIKSAGDSGAPDKADEHKVAKAVKKDPDNKGSQEANDKPKEANEEGKQKVVDEALFADPYGVLSRLATQAAKVSLQMEGASNDDATHFSGGAAFRDPFDPDFRKRSLETQEDEQQHGIPNAGTAQAGGKNTGINRDAPDEGGELTMVPPSPAVASGPLNEGKTSGQSAQTRLKATHSDPGAIGANTIADAGAGDNTPGAKATVDGATDKTAKGGPVDDAKANLPKDNVDPAKNNADSAEQLDAEIKETLRQAGIPDLPDIKVERKSDGLLISITDNLNFEMFTLSSATPRPELVVAMEKIGKLLQARAERIIVRGHTDARQFRSGTYDNWRLSSDRAHIVHYMLARGGLPEKRFERIEGYADRELKMPGDPKAASNRRIEILLRQPMP